MSQEVTIKFPIFDWRGTNFRIDHCESVVIEDNEIPTTIEEMEA